MNNEIIEVCTVVEVNRNKQGNEKAMDSLSIKINKGEILALVHPNHAEVMMRILTIFLIIFFSIVQIGAETKNARLIEELSIDIEATLSDYIASIGEIEVSNNGDIFIIDKKLNKICVLDSKGKFIREIGRDGRGPGEFQFPFGIRLKMNNDLTLFDIINSKFVVYKIDGKLVEEKKINFSVNGGYMLDNGNYLFSKTLFPSKKESFRNSLSIHNANLDEIKNIKVVKSIDIMADKIIGINYELSLAISRDRIIVGNPIEGYEISVFDFNGVLINTIKRDYEPVQPTEDYINHYIRVFDKSYAMIKNKLEFPGVLPPFHNLVSDEEGRIYVFTYNQDEKSRDYRVEIFEKDGEYKTHLFFKYPPYTRHALCIRNGRYYYAYEDYEGNQKMVAFKIIWQ